MQHPTIVTGTDYHVLPRNSACLVCRKRKQKCDGAKPICNECFSANRNCHYEDETYRTRTQLLQDRIKELEAQIRVLEEKQCASPLSPATSDRSSSRPPTHSSLPELSFASIRSPSSSGGSQAPLTPPTVLFSPDLVFPGAKSSFSPTPSHFELEPELLPRWPKSVGPDPPPDVINRLLEIFVQRHNQCGFELHIGRVMGALRPNASEPVIPALLNAMLLMACYFAQDPRLKLWENEFFERTKWEIETNITRAHEGGEGRYNALQHLQAMSMVGLYYYFKGRLLEGHVHTAHATQFALALGIHRLDSRIFRRERAAKKAEQMFEVKHWRPRDPIELGEAINLWWNCYDNELAGSTLNGLPPSVPFEDITTVWPRLLSDFEFGHTLPDDNYSIASLLDPQLSDIVVDASRDNVKSLIAKSYILMVYAAKLDIERALNPQGTEEWWTRFEMCDRAINQFMETMPPVALSRNVEELAYLVVVHTAIYCSQLQLHNVLSEYELALGVQEHPVGYNASGFLGGLSYARCNEACRATALAAALVSEIDMSYMIMFIGIAWVCVCDALTREIPRLRQIGYMPQAREKEQQLATIERSMYKLVATYPVLNLQLNQIQAMKEQQL